MAETRSNVNLTPTIWDDRFSTEFFQTNPFAAYQGTGTNNVIRVKEDYQSKRGNGITFEFITNLKRGTILTASPCAAMRMRLASMVIAFTGGCARRASP